MEFVNKYSTFAQMQHCSQKTINDNLKTLITLRLEIVT